VVSANKLALRLISGQFNNPSDELSWRVPPIGRDSLFLFPDGTYIYTTTTDVPSDTISDKGTWTFDGSIVHLQSDKDVT